LDACAAPGGKSALLLEAAARKGENLESARVVSADASYTRLRKIGDARNRLGHAEILPVCAALENPPFPEAGFDRVLVDAPCSGLGTVRRDPDIRWVRTEDELAVLAQRQLVLLARAADVVKPGGRLVYATCSSEPEENDGVVAAFLRQHPEFAPVDLRRDFAPPIDALVGADGFLRTSPVQQLEAFFAAALMRRP
jgi:16S rRNA (cytosine967-C5)-methyltransferase